MHLSMNAMRFLLLSLLLLATAGCTTAAPRAADAPVVAAANAAETDAQAPTQTSAPEPTDAATEPTDDETATRAPAPSRTASRTVRASGTASRTPAATRTVTGTATRSATVQPTNTRISSPSATPIPSATHTPVLPTPTTTPNAQGEIVHTAVAGETIVTIARLYGVLSTQLIAYNDLSGAVQPGQAIRIPVGMMSQNYTAGGGRNVATPVASAADENRVVLGPVTFDWQKLNNCGPTTTSVILSYYGISQPQLAIAGVLKPNPADKNVSPSEVAAYVRGQGMGAFVGINGSIALLERLLAGGYPVMVEQWMQYDGGVGHYRAVRGYDRAKQQILQEDTFLGPDIWRAHADFNRDWAYFNNTYIVFYPAADASRVAGLIGGDWDRGSMWQRALDTFRGGSGSLSLYGQAEALHQLGNDAAAIPLFEQAIAAGLPSRYLWYRFGYFEALNNQGRYQKTLDVSAPVIQAMGLSEDIRYHRAVAHRALGQTEAARRELTLALQDNPNHAPARTLLGQLPAAAVPTAVVPTATAPALPTWTPTRCPPLPRRSLGSRHRSPCPRHRSPRPRHRSPCPRRRSPYRPHRSPCPRRRSLCPRRRNPCLRHRSPCRRRRNPPPAGDVGDHRTV